MDITQLDVQYEDVQGRKAPSSPLGLAPELKVTESSPMTSEARDLGRDSPDMATPVVPSEDPVQVFGYLQKQGRRLKGWHQRWFEIRGQHMYHYKTNAKKHCLGEIELSICTDVHPTNAATFGHAFEIVTQERSHILAARTVEDMEKWIDTIKKNMGSRGGRESKKVTKVKKWDSFKNALAITRHRSASPSPQTPEPSDSHPAGATVTRNKSFLDRFKRIKRERSDSPSGKADKRDSLPRPLSLRSEDTPSLQLRASMVDPPTAVSVPTTPLSKKRQREKEAASHSPSPATQTPRANSIDPSPQSTPEHRIEDNPKHISTPETEAAPIFAKPKPLVKGPKPIPPERVKKSPKRNKESSSSVSQPVSDDTLPEILTQQLAWDTIKEMLEALPEESEQLFPDTLPPEDEPWMEKDTPIEQLREFLAVCA